MGWTGVGADLCPQLWDLRWRRLLPDAVHLLKGSDHQIFRRDSAYPAGAVSFVVALAGYRGGFDPLLCQDLCNHGKLASKLGFSYFL